MKMNPIVLVVGCLSLGLFGCATKDGQVGYLSPQQTTSSSEGNVASQTVPGGEASNSTSISRLPPPSLMKPVPDTTLSQPPPAELQPSSPESQPLANTVDSPDAQEQKAAVATQPAKKEETEQTKQEPSSPSTANVSSSATSNFQTSETRIAGLNAKRGTVVMINQEVKFAVVKFQYGIVPAIGNKLAVTRNGEKIGEVVVTKPIKPPHATVDILEGAILKGDIVE